MPDSRVSRQSSQASILFTIRLTGATAKTNLGAGDDFTHRAKFNLGIALSQIGDYERARELLRQCADQIDRSTPNTFMAYYARVRLGEALIGLKEYEQAERVLLKGYDGLHAMGTKSSLLVIGRIELAIELLITLYENWGKPEKVSEWKAKSQSSHRHRQVTE